MKISRTHHRTRQGVIKRNPRHPNKFTKYLPKLKQYYQESRASPNLKNALAEIIDAISKGNIQLAEEIAGVKSYVSGLPEGQNINVDKYDDTHFFEDSEYNEKRFGKDLYSYLDNLSFELSMNLNRQPAGFMIATSQGIQQRPQPKLQSRTLDLMRQEEEQIQKDADARYKRVKK